MDQARERHIWLYEFICTRTQLVPQLCHIAYLLPSNFYIIFISALVILLICHPQHSGSYFPFLHIWSMVHVHVFNWFYGSHEVKLAHCGIWSLIPTNKGGSWIFFSLHSKLLRILYFALLASSFTPCCSVHFRLQLRSADAFYFCKPSCSSQW